MITHWRHRWTTARTDTTPSICSSGRPRSKGSSRTIWWTQTIGRTGRRRPALSGMCWWSSSSVLWWARLRTACCPPRPRPRRPEVAPVAPKSAQLSGSNSTSAGPARVVRSSPWSLGSAERKQTHECWANIPSTRTRVHGIIIDGRNRRWNLGPKNTRKEAWNW